MWSRFQTGSKSPFAKRIARMLSTDSLPRKWSIRKTCDSSKTRWIVSLSTRADLRSVPKGFSTTTLALLERPVAPSMPTTEAKAPGGTARWKRRLGREESSFSAAATASSSGAWTIGVCRAEGQVRFETFPVLTCRLGGSELSHGASRVRPELLGGQALTVGPIR